MIPWWKDYSPADAAAAIKSDTEQRIRAIDQACDKWAMTDSVAAFEAKLKELGYMVVKR